MNQTPREGDLYRRITAFGKEFSLHYGYYDEIERHSKYNEPIPIYPDFLAEPQYTDCGMPFVTAMQDACPHYAGSEREGFCQSCEHYAECEDLLGVCRSPRMKRV